MECEWCLGAESDCSQLPDEDDRVVTGTAGLEVALSGKLGTAELSGSFVGSITIQEVTTTKLVCAVVGSLDDLFRAVDDIIEAPDTNKVHEWQDDAAEWLGFIGGISLKDVSGQVELQAGHSDSDGEDGEKMFGVSGFLEAAATITVPDECVGLDEYETHPRAPKGQTWFGNVLSCVLMVADGLTMAVSLSDTQFTLSVGLGQIRLKSDFFNGESKNAHRKTKNASTNAGRKCFS